MLLLLTLQLLLVNTAFNGVNVVAQLSNYAKEFNSLSSYILDIFYGVSLTDKESGFLTSVQVTSMYFNVLSNISYSSVKNVNNDIIRVSYYFDIVGCTYSPSVISKFLIFNTKVPNLCVFSTASSSSLTFDVKVSFVNLQTTFTLNSDVKLNSGGKFKMYTTTSTSPYIQSYYSDWILGAGKKLITKGLGRQLNQNQIASKIQSALSSIAKQYAFLPIMLSYYSDLMANNVLISTPTISNGTIQFQFDGQMSINGSGLLNSSATSIPTSVSSIDKSYQYIISQDLLQTCLNSYQIGGIFNVTDSYYFADLTIFYAYCNSTQTPTISITTNGAVFQFAESCSMYTNYLNNFTVTFNMSAYVNISLSNYYYNYNCFNMNPHNFSYSNVTIVNPSANISYSVFNDHMPTIVPYLFGTINNFSPDVPLPTPMAYNGMNWNRMTYYFNGYLVIGEDAPKAPTNNHYI